MKVTTFGIFILAILLALAGVWYLTEAEDVLPNGNGGTNGGTNETNETLCGDTTYNLFFHARNTGYASTFWYEIYRYDIYQGEVLVVNEDIYVGEDMIFGSTYYDACGTYDETLYTVKIGNYDAGTKVLNDEAFLTVYSDESSYLEEEVGPGPAQITQLYIIV